LKFTEFNFTPELMEGLDAMGFEEATPVQEQAIPEIMAGHDVLACAQTGTGKTAAFLLPVLDKITASGGTKHINTLIIAPTRELAVQIDRQVEGFSYFTPASSIPIYGGRDGQSMEMEKRALKAGAPIIVATPGRFIAHLDLGYVDLSKIEHLILDEADRMLDMGFVHDIMKIINHIPRKRQTLLFSATMPKRIRDFSKQIMAAEPAEINVAISKPAENIIQGVYHVDNAGKIPLTVSLLEGKKNLSRIIIFAGRKKTVRELATSLQRKGLKAAAISSDLDQKERENRLAEFRSGALPIVVATDVLSRGIDISGIDLVINFDVPGDAEDYVHRIGRTARAEASGIALTYVNGEDRHRFRRIEELIGMKVHRQPLPEGLEGYAPQPGRGGSGHGKGRGKGRGRGRSSNSNRNRGRGRGGKSKS
jgi:superfamily II DNA/RNA helicase